MSDPWRDETSFSRGETDRTPREWVLRTGRLRLIVHRHIHYPADMWLLSCPPWFDNTEIGRVSASAAKRTAPILVQNAIQQDLDALALALGAKEGGNNES